MDQPLKCNNLSSIKQEYERDTGIPYFFLSTEISKWLHRDIQAESPGCEMSKIMKSTKYIYIHISNL